MTAFYFSGGQHIRTVATKEPFPPTKESPEDTYVYIFDEAPYNNNRWFRHDITPVLLEDVPKEYRVLVLLLT